MAQQEQQDKLSIYIPKSKRGQELVKRLTAIGDREDRSINYLVDQAIAEYVERHGAK